jgi:hypothetical protein
LAPAAHPARDDDAYPHDAAPEERRLEWVFPYFDDLNVPNELASLGDRDYYLQVRRACRGTKTPVYPDLRGG